MGNHVEYVTPDSIEDIARGIWTVLTNTDYRKQLVEGAYERSRPFQWNHCVESLYEILETATTNSA
jgi:glycosyltransferase involved in cell wall biosynthesis